MSSQKYVFEIIALVTPRDGAKQKRRFRTTYRKPLEQWSRFDYQIMEKYVGNIGGVGSNVALIDVKEVQ